MSRDLMHSDEVKAVVREASGGIDSSTEAVACKLFDPPTGRPEISVMLNA